MSTTEIQAAFEAAMADLYPGATFGRFESGRYNTDWVENQWGGWQLAIRYAVAEAAKAKQTECGRVITDDCPPAAKATGTAGDAITMFRADLVSYCNAAFDEGIAEGLDRAARQPAPVVAVKTWQERAGLITGKEIVVHNKASVAYFMQQEIADLRAVLAATNRSQPVAEQGELPRAIGVSRDADSPGMKSVLVFFERTLTDNELRRLHDLLAASQQAAAQLTDERIVEIGYEYYIHEKPIDLIAFARAILVAAAPAIQQPQDERAAFEEWMRRTQGAACKRHGEDYLYSYTNFAWLVWQARAALAKKGGAA